MSASSDFAVELSLTISLTHFFDHAKVCIKLTIRVQIGCAELDLTALKVCVRARASIAN